MSKPDDKIPPEVLDVLKTISVDAGKMQDLITHGLAHVPDNDTWHTINDALDGGQCEVGNVIMLLAMVLDMLNELGLSVAQQSLLIGMYAQKVSEGRAPRDKEVNPKLN